MSVNKACRYILSTNGLDYAVKITLIETINIFIYILLKNI